jgi:hypothetical protein
MLGQTRTFPRRWGRRIGRLWLPMSQLALLFTLCWATASRASLNETSQIIEENNRRITDELNAATTLKFDNGSLEDVLLAFSQERHGIPLRLDTWSLFEAGVELPPRFSFDVREQKLADALKSVFKGTSDKGKNPVAVRAAQGLLQIDGGDATDRPVVGVSTGRIMVVRGVVLRVDGQSAAQCRVILRARVQTTATIADEHGAFAIPVLAGHLAGSAILVASADGHELTSRSLGWEPPTNDEIPPLNLRLERSKRLTIKVMDGSQQPIAGARTAIVGVSGAYDEQFYHGVTDEHGEFVAQLPESFTTGYIYGLKPGVGLDYRSFVRPRTTTDLKVKSPEQPTGSVSLTLSEPRRITIRYLDDDRRAIPGLVVYPWFFEKPGETDDLNGIPWTEARTNADGRVTFDWIPAWQQHPVIFWPRSPQYSHARLDFDFKQLPQEPLVTLQRLVELSGTVTDSDGKPVANASIGVAGAGYSSEDERTATTSGDDGRFRLKVPPYQLYMLVARSEDQRQASAVQDGISVYPGKPVGDLDLKLRPATRVFGRLTVGPDSKPIPKHGVQVYCYGRDLDNLKEVGFPHDANNHRWLQPSIVHWKQTDEDGRYEFWLGPGKYALESTQQIKATKFEVVDDKELEFNFHAERPERGVLRGKVVDAMSKAPVANAKITGVVQGGFGRDLDAVTGSDGEFEVTRDLHPAVLFASARDRALAGIVEIGPDDNGVTIPIAPTANYTARLVDKEKKPFAADRKITYGVTVHDDPKNKNSSSRWSFGGVVQPDADGRVQFKGLVVGSPYVAYLHNLDGNSYHRIAAFTPKEPGDHDLGELKVIPPTPYRAPTFDERIAQAFERPLKATERNRDAKDYARLADAHVLITIADPEGAMTKKLYKLYFDGELGQAVSNEYRTVAIPISAAKRADAEALANELGVELPKNGNPLIVAESADGKVLGTFTSGELSAKNGEIAEESLSAFLKKYALPQCDGQKLFDDALAQAKRENKRLLVQETATWFGPCHRLATFLDQNRQLWEKDFIWVRMDIRWSQASEIMKSLRGGAEGGYPWVAILNGDGKKLATSNNSEGANIGFPSELDEIEHFVKMFRSTAQRMTDDDFVQLKKALVDAQ